MYLIHILVLFDRSAHLCTIVSNQRRVIIMCVSPLRLASLVPEVHVDLCGLLTLHGKVK
jgi:hypothetical protein